MDQAINIEVKKLREDAHLPYRHTEQAAGWDLCSCDHLTVVAGKRVIVPTGIALAIPSGYVGLIMDRSGLAAKKGLTHLAGVMDSDYRGEYLVVLHNTSNQDYEIKPGDRIAQLLILPLPSTQMSLVEELSETDRGKQDLAVQENKIFI